MRSSTLRLVIVLIAAVAAAVSWHWGGAHGGTTAAVIVLLVCGLALGPLLLVRSWVEVRPGGVALLLGVATATAVGMLGVPQEVAEPSSPDADVVVPLAHLLGGGPVTSAVSGWNALSSIAMPLALVGAVAAYVIVMLVNRRTHGAGVESGSALAVFGVPREMFPSQTESRATDSRLHPPEAPSWSPTEAGDRDERRRHDHDG